MPRDLRAKTWKSAPTPPFSLSAPGRSEQVTVTAYREPLGELESPVTTRPLRNRPATAASISMDGQVRQLPGVELFRRSSSLVANPSSQGISLRGLGSTSASRTLVTLDDVPLNDPVGGWIHWEEQPELAVKSIEVVRGGASDLYGSSAIGGVVNVHLARPTSIARRTPLQLRRRKAPMMKACWPRPSMAHGELLWRRRRRSAPTATSRKPRGSAAPSISPPTFTRRTGFCSADYEPRSAAALRPRQRLQRSARQRHAIPDQRHPALALRHRRRLAGSARRHPGAARCMARPSTTTRRSPPSPTRPTPANPACSFRCGEIPSRFAVIPDNELGAAAHWNQPLAPGLLLLAGADVHDVRVLGPGADLRRHRRAHPSRRPSARLRRSMASCMSVHRAWTAGRFRPRRLVPELRRRQLQQTGSTWSPTRHAASAIRPDRLRSAPRRVAQARATIGRFRPRAFAPFAPLRRANFTAPRRSATSSPSPTARCGASAPRDGRRARLGMALGHDARQLLLTPGQPPHHRGHPQCQLLADPAACARTSARSRAAAFPWTSNWCRGAGLPSMAATSTRMPRSPAARRTWATGFPRSRATWPR